MKKIFIFILVSLCTFSFLAPSAEAHVLVTDKNIGAVFHTDPDDNPIAGEQTSFFFEFKDITNKFDPKNCSCEFSISQNGKIIYSQPLFKNTSTPSLTNASIFYSFPQKGTYTVTVMGKPNISGDFQPFMLVYPVEVNRGTHEASEGIKSTVLLSVIALVLVLSVLGGVILLRKKKK